MKPKSNHLFAIREYHNDSVMSNLDRHYRTTVVIDISSIGLDKTLFRERYPILSGHTTTATFLDTLIAFTKKGGSSLKSTPQ